LAGQQVGSHDIEALSGDFQAILGPGPEEGRSQILFLPEILSSETERTIEVAELWAPAVPSAVGTDRGVELEPEHRGRRPQRQRRDRFLLHPGAAGDP